MNRITSLVFLAVVASGTSACNGSDDTTTNTASSGGSTGDEDERGSVGPAHPSYEYCTERGGKIDNQQDLCVFADGTSCPLMQFWDGKCGQPHSYCEEHGGKLASKERNMGGWTAIVAVCTLDGKECDEQDFMQTGKCGQ